MISRAAIGALVVTVVCFAASVYGGYWLRRRQISFVQENQPGWCCMLTQGKCVVQESAATCRTVGGASYTWDQASCDAACLAPVPRTGGAQ